MHIAYNSQAKYIRNYRCYSILHITIVRCLNKRLNSSITNIRLTLILYSLTSSYDELLQYSAQPSYLSPCIAYSTHELQDWHMRFIPLFNNPLLSNISCTSFCISEWVTNKIQIYVFIFRGIDIIGYTTLIFYKSIKINSARFMHNMCQLKNSKK